MYCEDGEKIKSLMTPIADLRVSRLHLLLDQSFPGRCVLALNEHHNEVDELTEKQRTDFFTDLADAVAAIRTVFKPDKVNYAIFGDQVTHFHMHLVPKYKNGALWGNPYCAEAVPEAKLSAAETAKRVEDIRAALKKGRTQK
jgi:diadenosine tetraphosphate (Ap4A) HIT family hydrolase